MSRFKRNNNGGKSNAGRPSDYDPVKHPKLAFEICKRTGCTMKELAEMLSVPLSTFEGWYKDHEELSGSIKSGRDIYDTGNVEKALLGRALGYNYEEVKTEEIEITSRRKNNGDDFFLPGIKTTRTVKHVLPNITAMFFWLINRSDGRWVNTNVVEVKGGLESRSQHHIFDWAKIGEKLGVQKLEQLRNLIIDIPASDITHDSGSGQTSGPGES